MKPWQKGLSNIELSIFAKIILKKPNLIFDFDFKNGFKIELNNFNAHIKQLLYQHVNKQKQLLY